ncbi:hypothetical protein [Patulibacter sp. SYSU D01012]|uniref:hypothetical protein n=1 Tax=Patulibacter sp. SYSU D01012 TaxID=2817381 RepID=UPI001B30F470|nr:hypothetical protein [Patulibacter sp. SYSU D01012]
MRSLSRPSPSVLAATALLVSVVALVFAMTGVGAATSGSGASSTPSSTPRRNGVLRLGPDAKFPARAIPTVNAARVATRLGDKTEDDLTAICPAATVDLGSWCIQSSTQAVDTEDAGKNDYFYATQKCVELGGWLPSAEELIGAADQIKLSSTVDDNSTSASTDILPEDGLSDRREMSGTLITTTAGATAAGSMGSTAGAKGDPGSGQPDPVPLPADPAPDTLQYVTVYDNGNAGGFAGGKPVSSPERFRCAFAKKQGANAQED